MIIEHQKSQEIFKKDGFVVIKKFISDPELSLLKEACYSELDKRNEPIELEYELQYPGAPKTKESAGGKTIRRILDAYHRKSVFKKWVSNKETCDWLRNYFKSTVIFSTAHHNCIMTKHPKFGTATGWHQDIRYWSFSENNLVSVWMALGEENINNGGLSFIPGSHKLNFFKHQFDKKMFFREDVSENKDWIERSICPDLNPGDVVFFHCKTLHSANSNSSNSVKISLVNTYHGKNCYPLKNTRSSSYPEIEL